MEDGFVGDGQLINEADILQKNDIPGIIARSIRLRARDEIRF